MTMIEKKNPIYNQVEQHSINQLVYGAKVVRYNSKNKSPKERVYYILESAPSQLQWFSTKKEFSQTRINLTEITDISDYMMNFELRNDQKDQNLLATIQAKRKVLILKFFSQEQKVHWLQGLNYFRQEALNLIESDKKKSEMKAMALKVFQKADKDGSQSLEFEETQQLLKEMHIFVDKKFVEEKFKIYDRNNNNQIDLEEFKIMIQDLMVKHEVEDIFLQYIGENDLANLKEKNQINYEKLEKQGSLDVNQLQKFFQDVQKQNLSIEFIEQQVLLYQQSTINQGLVQENKEKIMIDFITFTNLLFNADNSIFDPKKQQIYQNMGRPLSDYYINSSHNTYLISNQLTGDSNVNAYKNALLRGCRCVELDVWDGRNSEPIITHGFTLTSSIKFLDVLRCIKDYGFITTPYPLVLSLETHCGKKQQKVMAQMINDVFGKQLYRLPLNYLEFKHFKSPQDLTYKIIIKNKDSIVSEKQLIQLQNDSNLQECFDKYDYLYDKFISEELFNKMQADKIKFQQKIIDDEINFEHNLRKSVVLQNDLNNKNNDSNNNNNQQTYESPQKQKNILNSKGQKKSIFDIYNLKEEELDNFDENLMIYCQDTQQENEKNNNQNQQQEEIDEFEQEESVDIRLQKPKNLEEIYQSQSFENSQRNSEEVSYSSPQKKDQEQSALTFITTMFGANLDLKDTEHVKEAKETNERLCWNISSIDEGKLNKIYDEVKMQKAFVDFHKQFFSRVYPFGNRVDSSNYDPVKGFCLGSQVIALNFQTNDINLMTYLARFQENGGANSGYVLKPPWLRSDCNLVKYPCDFQRIQKIIKITIISAQQIQYQDPDLDKQDISPQVTISLKGVAQDENPAQLFKTIRVKNESLKPKFVELHKEFNPFEFKVHCSDVAILVFQVTNADDKIISWYALPVNCIRPGFRVVPLWNRFLEKIEHSYLFVKVDLIEIK